MSMRWWLPGTRLWTQMNAQERILAADFPEDWKYYTLSYPTARYQNFSGADIVKEMKSCERGFYSRWQIIRRVAASLLQRRHPILSLVTNLSYRKNAWMTHDRYDLWGLSTGGALPK